MKNLARLLSEELETFYWIGFVMADGWVTTNIKENNRQDVFGLILSSIDTHHLEKLGCFIGIDVTTFFRNTNFKIGAKSCILKVNDVINVPKLKERFDIHNTKTEIPPNWRKFTFSNKQLISLFIGYIDGDGSITKRRNTDKLHLSIQAKDVWSDNLCFMVETFIRFFDIMIKSKPAINCRSHVQLSICKNELIGCLKIFAIKHRLPILHRKWDVVTNEALIKKKNSSQRTTFISPDGLTCTYVSVRKFAIDHDLPYHMILRLTSKKIKHFNGWIIQNEEI
jgi:hypothetical protein